MLEISLQALLFRNFSLNDHSLSTHVRCTAGHQIDELIYRTNARYQNDEKGSRANTPLKVYVTNCEQFILYQKCTGIEESTDEIFFGSHSRFVLFTPK